MLFLFRKIISQLLMPFPFSIFLGIIALLLGIFVRKKKLTALFGILSFLVLFLPSLPFVAEALIRPLERRYDPVLSVSVLPEKPVIVVLGGGKREEKGFPELLLLSDSASGRLAEGLRLYQLSPDGTLLFSGGTVWGGKPVSEVMAESAVSLGVPRSKVAALTKARATDEEVLEISDYLQNSASGSAGRIVLVTSASHLPRAMYLFERAGIKPVPAPADFQSLPPGGVSPDRFFPSGQALRTSERAIHEYLGILWILLKK